MQALEDNGAVQSQAPRHESQTITLEALSTQLNGRIDAFLSTEAGTSLLKRVQEQTRVCLRVCEDALSRYRYC